MENNSILFIDVNAGGEIEDGSMLDLLDQQVCGVDAVNLAWLAGDDVFKQGDLHAACLAEAVIEDIENPRNENARRLRIALRQGPEATLNFVRNRDNLKGLRVLKVLGKQVKGIKKTMHKRAVFALVMADVRARGLFCPNSI